MTGDGFKLVEPRTYPSMLAEWRGGPVTIAVFGYLFGQCRVQVWYDSGGIYPDILVPQC